MAQGPQGLRGPQGAKGDKGDLGATGSRGLTGQNGLPGHGAGPVFMAYNSAAQNIASGSSIMNLIYSTATANTGNYYNTATGVFTPLVAGFYQVNASIYPTGGDYFGSFFLGIYKNGSPISMGSAVAVQPGWGQPGASSATVLVYLNGTTDNINCKLTTTSATGSWTTIVSPAVFFQSVWVRGRPTV